MCPDRTYVTFIIDTYAWRIVGWRTSRTAHASFIPDAQEQAIHERQPVHRGELVHHSDRGCVGGTYDNTLAETINSLFKAEVIHRRGRWRSIEVEEQIYAMQDKLHMAA